MAAREDDAATVILKATDSNSHDGLLSRRCI